MKSLPLKVVEDVYRRFGEGDIDGFLALCADEIEWVVNGPSNLEKCRSYEGRSGVRQFLDLLSAWEFTAFEPREFFADGETVVVLGEEKGNDRASRKAFENRWVHVFDVQEGRITRFREFLCHWTEGQQPPLMSWGSKGPRG